MNWEKLKTFYKVSKVGSFTAAATELNITQSSLSRSIMLLEHELKTKLFFRTVRGLELTDHGKILLRVVQRMAAEAESAESLFFEDKNEPEGPLRVATTLSLASMWLPYYTTEFLERFPGINLMIIGNDEELDLNIREADAAIRPFVPHQPELIQRYLATFSPKLWASPKYLDKYGTPKTLKDLDRHRLITYNDDSLHPYGNINWILHAGIEDSHVRKSYLRINLGFGLLQMAEEGLGIIAMSPEYKILETSNLVQILPEAEGPSNKIYYSYPRQMKGFKRVECLGDYLEDVLSQARFKKESEQSSALADETSSE
jgi:DNA-binding transcriptional LysR family regulator